MSNDPAVGGEESARGQGAGSGAAPEFFPEEPRVSLGDADYADVVLGNAFDQAVNVASLSVAEDSDEPQKRWALRSAPYVLSAARRKGTWYRSYFNLVHESLSYLPAWPPGAAIEPGDVGMLAGGSFIALASLAEMGIRLSTSITPQAKADITLSSGHSRFNVEPADDGDEPTDGAARPSAAASRIEIRLQGEDASLAHWEGLTRVRIDDLPSVEKAVLALVREGKWPQDGVLVTEILRASNGLILISSEKESVVTCRVGRPRREVISDPISALGDPSLSISGRSGVAASFFTAGEFTACIRAIRIRRSFFSPAMSLAPVDRWE
jgi:hypothetical protein